MNKGEFNKKVSDLVFILQLFTNAMLENNFLLRFPELFLIALEPVGISRKVVVITKA